MDFPNWFLQHIFFLKNNVSIPKYWTNIIMHCSYNTYFLNSSILLIPTSHLISLKTFRFHLIHLNHLPHYHISFDDNLDHLIDTFYYNIIHHYIYISLLICWNNFYNYRICLIVLLLLCTNSNRFCFPLNLQLQNLRFHFSYIEILGCEDPHQYNLLLFLIDTGNYL